MEHKKTKIVLDADVIIHFMEANYFSIFFYVFQATASQYVSVVPAIDHACTFSFSQSALQ